MPQVNAVLVQQKDGTGEFRRGAPVDDLRESLEYGRQRSARGNQLQSVPLSGEQLGNLCACEDCVGQNIRLSQARSRRCKRIHKGREAEIARFFRGSGAPPRT